MVTKNFYYFSVKITNCNVLIVFCFQPHVVSGDHLVYSQSLQLLSLLSIGLGIDKVLCHYAAPPHNRTGKKKRVL